MSSSSFQASGIVTLLTDFGLSDTYVGQMKGVLHSLAPTLRIVDLTHMVAPQDIEEGSFQLFAAVDAFPSGAVHVAVVDPGVGTDRRAVCIVCRDMAFIGPDNGLFSLVLPRATAAFEIRAPEALRPTVTATFHGRDVFAPAAGQLAAGVLAPDALGPEIDIDACVRLPPAVAVEAEAVRGRVVSIDRFGNCITLLTPAHLEAAAAPYDIRASAFQTTSIGTTFADVAIGEAIALIGSTGTLELAVREGNAAERYGITRGDWVSVRSNGSSGDSTGR